MKGGITSGVVYPLAICELAQTYKLKNIGGGLLDLGFLVTFIVTFAISFFQTAGLMPGIIVCGSMLGERWVGILLR
jgi:hypothetical protein